MVSPCPLSSPLVSNRRTLVLLQEKKAQIENIAELLLKVRPLRKLPFSPSLVITVMSRILLFVLESSLVSKRL